MPVQVDERDRAADGLLLRGAGHATTRARSVATSSATRAWCRALLARGVYPPPSQFEAWFPSLAHTPEHIEPDARGGDRRVRRRSRDGGDAGSRSRRCCARTAACWRMPCCPAGRWWATSDPALGDARVARPGRRGRRRQHCAGRRGGLRGTSAALAAARGCSTPTDRDLALLAGDRLYALGLATLAAGAGDRGGPGAGRRHLTVRAGACRRCRRPRAGCLGGERDSDRMGLRRAARRGEGRRSRRSRGRGRGPAAGRSPAAPPHAAGSLKIGPRAPGHRIGFAVAKVPPAASGTPARRITLEPPWPIARTPSSNYTARPPDPRRVRGRDRHPPSLHDRDGAHGGCDRRCRVRAARPRLCRSARSSRRRTSHGRRSASRATSRRTRYRPRTITIDAGDRRRRQVDGVRAAVQPGRRRAGAQRVQRATSRSRPRCMHLGCPVRLRARRHSASSARATAASTTSSGKVDGGPPVRPLDRFYTRVVDGHRRTSARATPSTASCERFSPRDPGEPLDGVGQYLYPSRPTMRKLDGDLSDGQAARAARPQEALCADAQAARQDLRPADASRARPGGRRRQPSAGSTSAPRCPAAAAG